MVEKAAWVVIAKGFSRKESVLQLKEDDRNPPLLHAYDQLAAYMPLFT